MIAILLAAVYFASTWLGGRLRLEILTSHITHAAKRIYGVADFCDYAIADGLSRILSRHGSWNREKPRPVVKSELSQLEFALDG